MVKPLTAEEAYIAGRKDYHAAIVNSKSARFRADDDASDSEQRTLFMAEQIAHLWQRRINRGELPPLLEKAS